MCCTALLTMEELFKEAALCGVLWLSLTSYNPASFHLEEESLRPETEWRSGVGKKGAIFSVDTTCASVALSKISDAGNDARDPQLTCTRV